MPEEIHFSPDLTGPRDGNYRRAIETAYNTIQIVGIPDYKDNPNAPIASLYTGMAFNEQEKSNERISLIKALESKRVVLLGDPGSGKSTLTKFITYSFARIEPTPLAKHFGPRLPIPIILRDHDVRQWKSVEDMLAAAISRMPEMAQSLASVDYLRAAIEEGKSIVCIDGLDEISNIKTRRYLREILYDLIAISNHKSIIVFTSRIVGYNESPLEIVDININTGRRISNEAFYKSQETESWTDGSVTIEIKQTFVKYLAPFNKEAIQDFVRRWYVIREPDEHKRKTGIESLNKALDQSERIRQLAGNPFLLTMMGVIHRVTANLPNGRVKLYDKIVEASLETWQSYKGLQTYNASVEQMKAWLADVGWFMLNRRLAQKENSSSEQITIHKDDLKQCLVNSISKTQATNEAEHEATKFLAYLEGRSGLLIHRGSDIYVFLHLTFVEYFAAWHWRGQIRKWESLVAAVKMLADSSVGHEALVLLFEMLAEFTGTNDDLISELIQDKCDIENIRSRFFSNLLDDDDNGLSHVFRMHITEYILLSSVKSGTLFNIAESYQVHAKKILLKMLEKSNTPDELGEFFFFITSKFAINPEEMSLIYNYINNKNNKMNNLKQNYILGYMYSEDKNICKFIESNNSIRTIDWISDIGTYWIYGGRPSLIAKCRNSLQSIEKKNLLNAYMIGRLLLIKRSIRFLDVFFDSHHNMNLNITLANDLVSDIGMACDRIRSFVLPADRELYISRELNNALALYINTDLSLEIENLCINQKASYIPEDSIEYFFLPNNNNLKERNLFISKMIANRNSKNDWTQLLAHSSLILLGEGNDYDVIKMNSLIHKGVSQPNYFTFSEDLGNSLRPDLVAILRQCWLFDDIKIAPEMFDYRDPLSPYIRATGNELYSLMAEYLDPDKKTELWKWHVPREELLRKQRKRWAILDAT